MKDNFETIHLSFIGDVLPANLPYTLGFGNYDILNGESFEDTYPNPDIFFANLESPVLSESSSDEPFSGNAKIIEYFLKRGINIVTVANNHILEQGESGFHETVRLLKEKGIKVIGINEGGTSNIECFEIKNMKICFAAFNAVQDISNPGLYAELSINALDLALQKMEDMQATYKILTFHWGNEYYQYPNPEQVKIARHCIDKGCDLIIGHHPHVIQKVEVIKEKYVFYSLGNACFDYLFTPSVKVGLRVDIELNNNIPDIQYYPISANGFGLKKYGDMRNSLLLSENEVLRQNENSYQSWYSQKIKKVRLVHRIKMKMYLLWLFIVLPFQSKIKLFNNVDKHLKKH
jgi:gamma-polyglutamate biosynthesis protein CapA